MTGFAANRGPRRPLDDPYRDYLDPVDDPEDDESLRTTRTPAADGLCGWGPVAPSGGWASPAHRAAALDDLARRRRG